MKTLLITLSLLAATLVWFARRPAQAGSDATVAARELLNQAQEASGASFTFDRDTGRALEAARVQRLPDPVGPEELERALEGAGFELRPVGAEARRVFQVRPLGS